LYKQPSASFLEREAGREGEGHEMWKFLEETGWEVGEKMRGKRGRMPMVSIAFLRAELARLKQEFLNFSNLDHLLLAFSWQTTRILNKIFLGILNGMRV
jgi:hypothetical protein